MDLAIAFTVALAVAIVGIHVAATSGNGFALPASTRAAFGQSPETTIARPWAHLTAPLFHYDLGHLAYNLVILALTMPIAVRALGGRAALAALAASPVASLFVNLAIILPLAAAGVAYAQEATTIRYVGASLVIFAGAGMALAAQRWSWAIVAGILAVAFAYEATLAVTGVTQPFVGVYHAVALVLGVVGGYALR